MSTQDDDLYAKWSGWIDVLDDAVISLYGQRYIFREVQGIIRANPAIQSPGEFNFWMATWYSSSISVAIRKQTDKNKDSVSYRGLLEGIKANPAVLSRARYKKNFVGGDYTEADADEGFDQLVGVGHQHINAVDVDREINELENKAAKVTHYVNKRIAHHDKKDFKAIPKFSDLSEAIDYVGVLHQKYYALFRGYSTELLPVWQYDWKKVFRYPWISSPPTSE